FALDCSSRTRNFSPSTDSTTPRSPVWSPTFTRTLSPAAAFTGATPKVELIAIILIGRPSPVNARCHGQHRFPGGLADSTAGGNLLVKTATPAHRDDPDAGTPPTTGVRDGCRCRPQVTALLESRSPTAPNGDLVSFTAGGPNPATISGRGPTW